jgi:hypothetical protein
MGTTAQCCRRCCTVTYGDSADIDQGEVIAQQAPKAKEFTPVTGQSVSPSRLE